MSCVPEYEICRTRGDTKAELFQLKVNGVAVDISGDSFMLTVDPAPDPPDNTTKLFDIAGVLVTPASGIFSFAPSTIQPTTPGDYYYDIQWTDSSDSSRVKTILKGKYTVEQDITK